MHSHTENRLLPNPPALTPTSRRLRAFGPASIGNFGAGFDILGAAIRPVEGPPLGDWVDVWASPSSTFSCDGPFAHRLPSDPQDNLVLKARAAYERQCGRRLPPLSLHLHKGLPVGSGLGSSSASVVATLVALNAFLGDPFNAKDLLTMAGEAESHGCGAAHLDNVAPAAERSPSLAMAARATPMP